MPFEEVKIHVESYSNYHNSSKYNNYSNSSNCDSQRARCLLENSRFIVVLTCLFSSFFPLRDHNYSIFSTFSERGGCLLRNFRFLFALIAPLLTIVLMFVTYQNCSHYPNQSRAQGRGCPLENSRFVFPWV